MVAHLWFADPTPIIHDSQHRLDCNRLPAGPLGYNISSTTTESAGQRTSHDERIVLAALA